MNVENPAISRKISLSSGGEMEVEISSELIEKIKKEYGIDTVDDLHIQVFFRDILHDVNVNL
jgi:hypothetical protein